MEKVKKILIFIILVLMVFVACYYLLNISFFSHKLPAMTSASVFTKPGPVLSAFTLTDTNGNKVTEKSLRGNWHVLYFGYTACPSVCPTTLAIIKDVWGNYSPSKLPPARFIFVSINPEPDPVHVLRSYLKKFDERFIGFSGSPQEVKKLSKQLGIFAKLNNLNKEQFSDGIPSIDIDHTNALLILDPKSRLRAIFTPPYDPNIIAKDLDIITKLY